MLHLQQKDKEVKRIFDKIKNNRLFEGITSEDFNRLTKYMTMTERSYKKGEIILLCGDEVTFVGLVMLGSVKIIKEDFGGNAGILSEVHESELFGEAFVCSGIKLSSVTVIAVQDSMVLLIDFSKLIASCPPCRFYEKIILNMLHIISEKALILNQKIEVLSKRTTREKLLCFFYQRRGEYNRFTLPFNREELAQYLCVDRSAMSAEISRMRADGIIRIDRREVEILI